MKKIFSIVLVATLLITACFALTACQEQDHYDSITKTLKLTRDYEGKSFLVDGIGKATVSRYTDGDTTAFLLEKENIVISIRYHSIDTPESTGGVEKWGKAASNFTKHQLESATEIVLESHTGGKAEHDAYGTRYLGYVWYKPEGSSSFKCLNLEIVENGYSRNNSQNTSEYRYYKYFDKAEDFASRKAIHLFSSPGTVDPLFNDEPIDISIKELWETIYDPSNEDNNGFNNVLYNADADSGAKIRFTGYLESLTVYNDAHTFKAVSYDPETGKRYEIDIYAMYGNQSQSKMKIGYLYTFIGTIQRHSNNFQISGITYNTILSNMKDGTEILQKDYYLTFNSSTTWFSGLQYSATLYSDITVTEVGEVVDGVLTFKGTAAKRISADSYNEETREFTFTVTVPSTYAGSVRVGSKISVGGYQFEYNTGNITIASYSAITIK